MSRRGAAPGELGSELRGGEIIEGGASIVTARTVTFTIPPAAETPFLFRRALLHAIRLAIGEAQIRGELETEVAVECFRALPT